MAIKRKTIKRLFEIRSEVLIFLFDRDDVKSLFTDENWLQKLSYLVNIFDRLNILNMSLQESHETNVSVDDRINSFKMKFDLFTTQINKNGLSAFSMLSSWLHENDLTPE